jgi:hypothetical protein
VIHERKNEMTVRNHLRELHTNAADTHTRLAKCHAAMGKCYSKLAGSDDDNKDAFGELASQHQEMSKAHADAAEQSIACCKSLGKSDEGDGDRLEPTHISAVYKSDNQNLRAVPRNGSPNPGPGQSVPAEFAKLVEVSEEIE